MSVYKEPIDWIRQSIDSILNQTYMDFEFVIVNDSPDRVDNITLLEEYRNMDNRVVILTNETNIGLTKSLNNALAISKGEYIARMDADDISLQNRFQIQVDYLNSHSKTLAVGSWTGSIDENGNRLVGIGKYETRSNWIRAQFLQNSQLGHPTVMFRRLVNGKPVQYDDSVKYAQDYSLWVSILPYGDIVNIPEVLFCYRTSEQQITTSKKSEQQECARVAQAKAFSALGFNPSKDLLDIFFMEHIKHEGNTSIDDAYKAFTEFFDKTKLNIDNKLALEIIYCTYLGIVRRNSKNSMDYLCKVLGNSSIQMLYLGLCLTVHLMARKLQRTLSI